MLNIERRIAALEASADDGLSVVIVEDGETQGAALERLGLSDAPVIETIRVRESDFDPTRFHGGDYCPAPPASARHQRQAADAWVNVALRKKGQLA